MEIGNVENQDQSEAQITHLALDIGGSLIKLVYFSRSSGDSSFSSVQVSTGNKGHPVERKLHFVTFEIAKVHDCIDFIKSLGISGGQHLVASANEKCVIKATGGGAYKFADFFKERLGICLSNEDELGCLVAGANFLLKLVPNAAFTYMNGQKEFVQNDHDDLYPYLLVTIGSGVSINKVDGPGKFELVCGTNIGGGTFWGLGRLLTKCKSFDELLELSHRGNNGAIDMSIGDTYGTDYKSLGGSVPSTVVISAFGKAISDNKELEDYTPEDVSRSLLRMISYNIGKISCLNALRFGIKRIYFGGSFIRGHAYTMDTITSAVHIWSKGEAKAMFLRHGGFLGALGAFMSYKMHGFENLMVHHLVQQSPICELTKDVAEASLSSTDTADLEAETTDIQATQAAIIDLKAKIAALQTCLTQKEGELALRKHIIEGITTTKLPSIGRQ